MTPILYPAFIWLDPRDISSLVEPIEKLTLAPFLWMIELLEPNMYEWRGNSAQPEFDQALAESYIGKYILIGVTYLAHDGSFLEQVQMHGVVESVSPNGVQISLRGKQSGETWLMPPHLDSVSPAKLGTYSAQKHWRNNREPRPSVHMDSHKTPCTMTQGSNNPVQRIVGRLRCPPAADLRRSANNRSSEP